MPLETGTLTPATPLKPPSTLKLDSSSFREGRTNYNQGAAEVSVSAPNLTKIGTQNQIGTTARDLKTITVTARKDQARANIGAHIVFSIPFTGIVPTNANC